MRYRRRRKAVEWVTTNYSSFPDFDGTSHGILPLMTTVYGGATQTMKVNVNETPILVGDEPDVANTLTEERKSYTIRRIVGDMHFMWGRDGTVATGGSAGIHPIMCKWGFAVKNVPPDIASLTPGGERVWNAFDDSTRDFSEMDWMSMTTEVYGANHQSYPLNSTMEPGWEPVMGDNAFDTAHIIQDRIGYCFPASRKHHVDIRVNRTVRRNQRLFINMALAPFMYEVNYDWTKNPHAMLVFTDLRILINWRAAYNRKG